MLLGEAARGRVPVDQLLLKSLIERPDAVVEFLAGLTEEATEDWTFDLTPELLDLARYFADARLVPFLIDTLNDEDPPSEG